MRRIAPLVLLVLVASLFGAVPPGHAESMTCVGDPPRQTEDPDSPPCIAFYEGDNFGSTYQGVTADEIRVLVYLDDGCYDDECIPESLVDTLVDLDASAPTACPATAPERPVDTCDPLPIRVARGLNTHFDERFQSYNRDVHAYAFVSSAHAPEERRMQAALLWQELNPFAILNHAVVGGHATDFTSAMTARGVMAFGTPDILTPQHYESSTPLAWDFQPDALQRSKLYADYVCEKVAPHPVSRFGDPPGIGDPNGEERRFGIFHGDDETASVMGSTVSELVGECLGLTGGDEEDGILDEVEALLDELLGEEGDDEDFPIERYESATEMKADGVTTVLWTGGVDPHFTQEGAAIGYYPEIVLLGDEVIDGNAFGRVQHQAVWQNAWGVQFPRRIDGFQESFPALALAEGTGTSPGPEETRWALLTYRDHFLLATAIQVAGPRLNPSTVEQGLRAIPERHSTHPYQTAFFFDADHTGLKDAMEIWWARTGMPLNTTELGCMRMVEGGSRHRMGDWSGATQVFDHPDDPCSGRESPTVRDVA